MLLRKLLFLTITLIILSPLVYFSTGIGQKAHTLSPEPVALANGTLQSSPKAEALHSLSLPIRVERLLVYPILLFLMQYSGLAVKLRAWLTEKWLPPIRRVPGFKWLDRRLARLTRNQLSMADVVIIGLYLTLISLGLLLIYFPFSIYSGFVLRHQFGLSTQTLAAWLRDFGVGWLVNWGITFTTFGGFYLLLKLASRRWPIWGGLGFTLFTFGYIVLEPIVITPLFYEISPVTDLHLQHRIQTMVDRAGVVIDDISIINASSKTTAVNAYFTGYGGASKIFLWDTLLQKHPSDEVDVVIAHEMGHWVYRHVLLSALAACALGWLGLFVWRFWSNRRGPRLGWRGPGDVASYPYLLGMMALVGMLAMPVMNGVSRFAEGQADDFALAVSQKPAAAAAMFERLAQENLAMVDAPTWEKTLFYSHPPLAERIAKAKKWP
ncbi:MAG: M48 family metalloprotease [Anaerolineae bacterium]|nr:M48 family metalloprotease [Anaerolineae bacterium]